MSNNDAMNEESISNYFKHRESEFTEEERCQVKRIIAKLKKAIKYHPRIGVFGKTGTGKSSLCNSLFGHDLCEISDISACTRAPKDVLLQMDKDCSMTLVDVPGIGESQERDEEYAELYGKLLPELDIILWLIKADDRAFSIDKEFFNNIITPHLDQGKPFFMVLNQVDKIAPHKDWDEEKHCPGESQFINIEKKRAAISEVFGLLKSKVLAVAATEKYNLTTLVDEIVFALPDDKKLAFVKEVNIEYVSPVAKKETRAAIIRICEGAVAGAALGAEIGKVFGRKGAAIGRSVGAFIGGIAGFFSS